MKKIEAVIKPFKFDEVKEALEREKIQRVTIFEVKGAGSQQGSIKHYRGAQYFEDSHEIKIEIIVDDDEAKRLAGIIVSILRTGDLCDGEVIIVPIEELLRVRVGQRMLCWIKLARFDWSYLSDEKQGHSEIAFN